MRQSLRISVRVAWWLRWYLAGVWMMSTATKLEPDCEKVGAVVGKAIRIKVEP